MRLLLLFLLVVVGIGTADGQVVRCLTTNSSLTGEINEIVVQMDGEVTFNGSAKLLAAGFSVKLNGYRPLLVKNAVISSTNITLELYTGLHGPDPQTGYKPNLTYVAPAHTYILTVGGTVYNGFTCDGVMEDHAKPRLLNVRFLGTVATAASYAFIMMFFSEPVIRCPSVSSDHRLTFTSAIVATFGNGDGWFPVAPATSDPSMMVWEFHSSSTYETDTLSGTVTVIGGQVCEANNTGLVVDHMTKSVTQGSSGSIVVAQSRQPVIHDINGDGIVDMIVFSAAWPQLESVWYTIQAKVQYSTGPVNLGIAKVEIERINNLYPPNVYLIRLNDTRPSTSMTEPFIITAAIVKRDADVSLHSVFPAVFDGTNDVVLGYDIQTTTTDLTRPTILAAFVLLTNETHGFIDVTLSEATSFGSSPTISDFFLFSVLDSQILDVTASGSMQMRLNVSMTYRALSGQPTPDRLSLSLDVTQATVSGATGIPDVSAYFSNMLLVSNDTIAPWITSAFTFDTDSNGRVDLISISYSETLHSSYLNISIAYPITAISVSANVQQTNFTLDEGVLPDTAVLFALVYPSVPIDINGNHLVNQSLSTTDRAPPVLLSASSSDDLTLAIQFSEVVSITSLTSLFGTSGSATLGDCVHDGDLVSCSITGTIDYDSDTITVASTSSVRDSAGNAMVYKGGSSVLLTVSSDGSGSITRTSDASWGALEYGLVAGLSAVVVILLAFLIQPYFGAQAGFSKLPQQPNRRAL